MTVGLLSPMRAGELELANRIVMSPMTRRRASAGGIPTAMNATYYAQRASAGLIITEATDISPYAVGYANTPGIWTAEQVAGWRLVTDAVHARGGRIMVQLWHTGRISHPSLLPGGALPVAPSAIAPPGMATTYTGRQPFVTPRALSLDEIPGIIGQFEHAARNAREAGFDGVELHGANGYLLDEFLRDSTNHRTDAYGGPPQNRARLLFEVVEAVVGVWGGGRVGVRVSPVGTSNDMSDSNPSATYRVVAEGLNRFGLAFLEVRAAETSVVPVIRETFDGALMLNEGLTFELANTLIATGEIDLASFARLYISNPDLVERFADRHTLAPSDKETYYGGTEAGYTDYPSRDGSLTRDRVPSTATSRTSSAR
jgi:N-ethylmaleimide reductase